MGLNQRAQAALTDSLFFLTIVSGLVALMFVFSSGYGQSVSEAMIREYRSDYVTSAMKTILFSSAPRNPDIPLNQSTEVDYLFTMVKEDFADDKKLSADESRNVLRDTIVGIMEPLADNFDYLFYIYIVDATNLGSGADVFPIFILYTSSWNAVPVGSDTRKVTIEPESDRIYFCSPDSLDPVDFLLSNVGSVQQESSRIELVVQQPNAGGRDTLPAQTTLALWTAAQLPPGILDSGKLNCTCNVQKEALPGPGGAQWVPC